MGITATRRVSVMTVAASLHLCSPFLLLICGSTGEGVRRMDRDVL